MAGEQWAGVLEPIPWGSRTLLQTDAPNADELPEAAHRTESETLLVGTMPMPPVSFKPCIVAIMHGLYMRSVVMASATCCSS